MGRDAAAHGHHPRDRSRRIPVRDARDDRGEAEAEADPHPDREPDADADAYAATLAHADAATVAHGDAHTDGVSHAVAASNADAIANPHGDAVPGACAVRERHRRELPPGNDRLVAGRRLGDAVRLAPRECRDTDSR